MKLGKIFGVVAAMVVATCIAGCGGSSSSSSSDSGSLSENQSVALAEQISGAAINGMIAGMSSSANAQTAKGVSCNPDTGVCQYNIPISYRSNCTAGGRMELSGSITGQSTTDSAYLSLSATQTITDWACITGFIVNGDPYISLTGTFTYLNGAPATRNDMTVSGGFKWGDTAAESCQISLAISFYNDGTGTISGTICGYDVSASV